MIGGETSEQIHERTVEERIAFADHGNVVAGAERRADLDRSAVIHVVRGKPGGQQRHADGDLALGAGQMSGDDFARQAGALFRRRPGQHGHGCEDA